MIIVATGFTPFFLWFMNIKIMHQIGSSEWAEEYQELLTWRTVAYLNVDVGVSGYVRLEMGATPQLDKLLRESAKIVLQIFWCSI